MIFNRYLTGLCAFIALCTSRESKITASERMRIGGNPAMATLEIVEPIEKDKGMYTIEIVDPEKTHTRTLDLSGQRELFKCVIP